jgi:hypothetical protein
MRPHASLESVRAPALPETFGRTPKNAFTMPTGLTRIDGFRRSDALRRDIDVSFARTSETRLSGRIDDRCLLLDAFARVVIEVPLAQA